MLSLPAFLPWLTSTWPPNLDASSSASPSSWPWPPCMNKHQMLRLPAVSYFNFSNPHSTHWVCACLSGVAYIYICLFSSKELEIWRSMLAETGHGWTKRDPWVSWATCYSSLKRVAVEVDESLKGNAIYKEGKEGQLMGGTWETWVRRGANPIPYGQEIDFPTIFCYSIARYNLP